MIRRHSKPRRPLAMVAVFAALVPLFAAGAFAQAPADALFRDFEPVGDFLFELEGEALSGAEIYFSRAAAAYLVMAPELSSPVLIIPGSRSVESVHLMKVAKRDDGRVDILADAEFNPLGGFRIEGSELAFDLKGKDARLREKPPLLGFQKPQALRDYKPEYGRLASDYKPSTADLSKLRGHGKEVEVLIYFGTWCPTCGRLVPRVLKIDDELAGSKLDFRYYGLPTKISDDPAARRDDIHGVPTGIVKVNGKEVARLGVKELNRPEAALSQILGAG